MNHKAWYEQQILGQRDGWKNCPVCLAQTAFRQRGQKKYCSPACYSAAQLALRRAREAERRCVICGAQFAPRGPQRYCGATCRDQGTRRLRARRAARRKRQRKRIRDDRRDPRHCAHCLTRYAPTTTRQVYCGPQCSAEARNLRRRTTSDCIVCGGRAALGNEHCSQGCAQAPACERCGVRFRGEGVLCSPRCLRDSKRQS